MPPSELNDLRDDPYELHPQAIGQHPELVRELLADLVDAGSAASPQGVQTGRW